MLNEAKFTQAELTGIVTRLTNFYIEAMKEAGLSEEDQQAVLYGVLTRQFKDLIDGVNPTKA